MRRVFFGNVYNAGFSIALKAETPVHVVSQRLGHKRIEITLNVYAHALPSMQRDAADRIGALLHR